MRKAIICFDFDGVLHSYDSGWKGAAVIPDGAVPGAMEYLLNVIGHSGFEAAIYSSRSSQYQGIPAMQRWLEKQLLQHISQINVALEPARVKALVHEEIQWPTAKPPAKVTIDDRAIQFTGAWPAIEELEDFVPWNKKKLSLPLVDFASDTSDKSEEALQRAEKATQEWHTEALRANRQLHDIVTVMAAFSQDLLPGDELIDTVRSIDPALWVDCGGLRAQINMDQALEFAFRLDDSHAAVTFLKDAREHDMHTIIKAWPDFGEFTQFGAVKEALAEDES